MTSPTAWAERTVVKDAPALFDKAASLPSCRLGVMDSLTADLELDDLIVSYYYDPSQKGSYDQIYQAASVAIKSIESLKMMGTNLLPLFSEPALRTLRHDILRVLEEE